MSARGHHMLVAGVSLAAVLSVRCMCMCVCVCVCQKTVKCCAAVSPSDSAVCSTTHPASLWVDDPPPYKGCCDVSETSIKPSRHAVGLFNVNRKPLKMKNYENFRMSRYSVDLITPHTATGRLCWVCIFTQYPLRRTFVHDGDGSYYHWQNNVIIPCISNL